ncbi:rhodanese-like domain-containing protein [Rhodoferax sp. GW822-FHT02A01]|uniref:sulfurtransferase n=1 Tax=Rhodoferax sp. GW822-FHT02A01 TaxID=3141537 RepID=UPI00315DC2E2
MSAAPESFRSDLMRWRQLVSVPWLAKLIAGRQVAAAPAHSWKLFEVACDGRAAYRESHIPAAGYLDTLQFENAPLWNKVADAELLRVMEEAGIGPHTTMILYGRNTLAAARVAHLLLYAGVQDVRLLDGGFDAWCAAGQPLHRGDEQQSIVSVSHGAWPGSFPARPELLLDMDQTKKLLDDHQGTLVSIRSRAEFMGETSGYDYIAVRGEIPGALWGHAGRDGDVNHMGSFQLPDGRMKPAADIAAVWAEAGIHPHMHIAFYCGTGWRASLAFFYAWLMGWEHISVYDGGWLEWSSDPANPVVCRCDMP